MSKFIVFGGKRLLVPLTTCDDREAADLFKVRGDAWYGSDHPLTPLTVAELDSSGEIKDGHSYVVALSARYGIQTIFHSIQSDKTEAEVVAESIETPAFQGKVEEVRHNMKPFPDWPA